MTHQQAKVQKDAEQFAKNAIEGVFKQSIDAETLEAVAAKIRAALPARRAA